VKEERRAIKAVMEKERKRKREKPGENRMQRDMKKQSETEYTVG